MTNINFKELAGVAYQAAQIEFMIGQAQNAADNLAEAAAYAYADGEEGARAADGLFEDAFPKLVSAGADLAKVELAGEVVERVDASIIANVYTKLGAASTRRAA